MPLDPGPKKAAITGLAIFMGLFLLAAFFITFFPVWMAVIFTWMVMGVLMYLCTKDQP